MGDLLPKEVVKYGRTYKRHPALDQSGPAKGPKKGIGRAGYVGDDGRGYYLDEINNPWFLTTVPGREAVGRIIHNLPQFSFSKGESIKSRLGYASLGLFQSIEQAIGELGLGSVAGEQHASLQQAHEWIEGMTGGKLSKSATSSLLRKPKLLRSLGYALFLGHIDGLARFQSAMAETGQAAAFFDQMRTELEEEDPDFKDPTTAEAIFLLHQTAPEEARSYIEESLAGDSRWQTVMEEVQDGRRIFRLPCEFVEQRLLVGEGLQLVEKPDVYTYRAFDGFRRFVGSETETRLNFFMREASPITAEGESLIGRRVEAAV